MDNVRRKLGNVRPSWRALVLLWHEEFSFRFQSVVAVGVFALAIFLDVTRTELLLLVTMIGAVLATEALNTAIEELCDHVTPDTHPQIGKVKDLASGASLLIGLAAVAVGALIFVPRLFL